MEILFFSSSKETKIIHNFNSLFEGTKKRYYSSTIFFKCADAHEKTHSRQIINKIEYKTYSHLARVIHVWVVFFYFSICIIKIIGSLEISFIILLLVFVKCVCINRLNYSNDRVFTIITTVTPESIRGVYILICFFFSGGQNNRSLTIAITKQHKQNGTMGITTFSVNRENSGVEIAIHPSNHLYMFIHLVHSIISQRN